MIQIERPALKKESSDPGILEQLGSGTSSYLPDPQPSTQYLQVPSVSHARRRRYRPSLLRRATSAQSETATISRTKLGSQGNEDLFDDMLEAKVRCAGTTGSFGFDDDATSIFSSEADMPMLDLSDSGFDSVPVSLFAQADTLMRIQSLDLSRNPLGCSEDLYMTENLLLPQLTSLYLCHCNMAQIEPLLKHLKAPNLLQLDISNHKFSGSVPEFQPFFPKLDTLIASQGRFSSIEERAARGLRLVDLTDNSISQEDGDRFVTMCSNIGTKLLV